MKKKILFVTHSLEITGGAELEFQRLLKVVSEEYDELNIDCLMPDGPAVNIINKYVNTVGIYKYGFLPVVHRNISDYLRYLYISTKQIKDFRKFIKNNSYDLCVFNVAVLIVPAIYLKLRGFKNVFLIKEKVEPKFIRYILYKLINVSSVFVFFNSAKIKDEYVKFTASDDVMSLYTSVYTYNPDVLPKVTDKLIEDEILIDENKFNLLCVGDITERKNQSLLLEAFNSLKEIREQLHLHLVGDFDPYNEYYNFCQGLISKFKMSDRITFYGKLEHSKLYGLLNKVDMVVICSISEGIPYILFDTLRFGKILIATDVGGISEIIIDNKTGFLIPVNYKALAEKIDWVFKNKNNLNYISENSKITFKNYSNSNEQLKIMINKLISLANSDY